MPYDVLMSRILLIGATGTIGRHVAAQLAAAGASVRALVRNPETAHLPPQIELAPGDLRTPESLDRPLQGVDAVFLIWTAPPQSVASVIARIAANAQRIVYLSAPFKTPHPFFQQPNPARTLGENIEHAIESSRLQWTFLRPGMFAANALTWWAPQIREGQVIRWPYLSAATAPIDPRDIATIACRALSDTSLADVDYVLTGPESLTQLEQLTTIGRVLGRNLAIEEMTPEETHREWAATWPAPVIDMLLSAWAAAVDLPAFISETFEQLTASRPHTFEQWAASHAQDFQS
jgi:uncharacterized protein YbjT (DUF2867 family)